MKKVWILEKFESNEMMVKTLGELEQMFEESKDNLDEKGIEYNVIEDVKKMREMGLMSAPALQIEDDILTFSQAIKWVREYGE